VLHAAATVRRLVRPGRVVLVDEAFVDTVPGEAESLSDAPSVPGLLVLRSLTKHWGIPGVRAGYLLGEAAALDEIRRGQTPWSVSSTAIAALTACSTEEALAEAETRALQLVAWREHLEKGLAELGVEHVPSSASFVLARVGRGVHRALRERGIAVRRADTFPGLDDTWVRIAVRPAPLTDHLVSALTTVLSTSEAMP
jgi:histidinol-phosphate/aromatic aminotransferase/cobyric acid decarboxylase-like protein